MATAAAGESPPSTSAGTTWAWICGCASPPMEPTTTHGRPSRRIMAGMSVWSVRFRGARRFARDGSRLKYAPRFCSMSPWPIIPATAQPNVGADSGP